MSRMRAVDAIVRILEKEGATQAFGVPGAAINPLYSAMKEHGGIRHVLARHVEGASHMAEGFTRAKSGNIGVCIGTSGPGGTDMITGLYSASADSIPILCTLAEARRYRYQNRFQQPGHQKAGQSRRDHGDQSAYDGRPRQRFRESALVREP